MLRELRVRDLAVIADVTLPLRPGLNVLTGETGAGKSILVDALSLLLGERASGHLVRPNAARASVEAAFEIDASNPFVTQADQTGIPVDDGEFVVRREINVEGRNRAWANGSRANVATLAELGRSLVDLHGQHESQSLLRATNQRDILDAFAGLTAERREMVKAFDVVRDLEQREAEVIARRDDILKRADYLRHIVQEIEEVHPTVGEVEELEVEAKRLAHAEELTRLSIGLADQLDGEDGPSMSQVLSDAARTLEQLERIDPSVARWRSVVESATVELENLSRELRDYGTAIDVDPNRLDALEQRRDRLYKLTKKYGPGVEGVDRTLLEAKDELDTLGAADLDLTRLVEAKEQAHRAMDEISRRLRTGREAAAGQLAQAVGDMLPSLGLRAGRLQVRVEPLAEATSTGADAVTFLVQLNQGLEARPLAQVASGGELSRIMLSLKVVLAQHDVATTLVFDEVDQGIGGEVGHSVAAALRTVAATRQVLVITHLPQIAARANHHIHIKKGSRGGVATAQASVLGVEERVVEIARMLGNAHDQALLQHARDLLTDSGTAAPPKTTEGAVADR